MAIGYAPKDELLFHSGHDLEISVYEFGDESLVSIDCMTCGMVLIDSSTAYRDIFLLENEHHLPE